MYVSHHHFVKSAEPGIRVSYPVRPLHQTCLIGPRLMDAAREPPRQLPKLATGTGRAGGHGERRERLRPRGC